MATWFQDLKFGARLLVRAPGFALMAVAALAIGIGANTAVFSVIHALILEPPPYRDPSRLAIVWERNLPRNQMTNVASPGNYLHWRDMNRTFEDLAAMSGINRLTLTGAGEPEQIPLQAVTANFFTLLGVTPALGRAFTAEEDRPDNQTVVISDRLWRRIFQADPAVTRRAMTLDGVSYTIIGVMPPGFAFLDKEVDLWTPVGFTAEDRTPMGRGIRVFGRLKPGATVALAQEDMARVAAELRTLFPNFNTGWTTNVVGLQDQLTGDVRPALFVLIGAVACVLLIGCANVANLLLARATARQREMAVRAALGAARGRLVRQLMAESLLLASVGGAVGLALAWWAVHLVRVVVAERLPIPRLETVTIDATVLAFTLGTSVLSGLFFGLVPALSAASARFGESLKEGGRTGSAARGARTRGTFVVIEVALALMLLIGAGLLVRSFVRLLAVDPGFDPTRTITMRVSLPQARYPDDPSLRQFFDRLIARVDALPSVEASGATTFLPMAGGGIGTRYYLPDLPAPPPGQDPTTDVSMVTRDYFKTMRVPLLRGRLFNENDPADRTNKVIVNETLAKRHWPGQDPIGKRLRVNLGPQPNDEIIGVVGDVRLRTLDVAPRSSVYWPYSRRPSRSLTLTVRTTGDPTTVTRAVVNLIRDEDPQLALANVKTMEELVDASVAQRRLIMLVLAMFAGAALLLAAVGIHGVIAYSVTQRTQEIGIRMALGAQAGDVLRMVVGQALLLAGIGIVVGGVGAVALSRVMKGLLFNVTPVDPATYAAVTAALAAVAAFAAWLPGRRATRVDPVIALRAE